MAGALHKRQCPESQRDCPFQSRHWHRLANYAQNRIGQGYKRLSRNRSRQISEALGEQGFRIELSGPQELLQAWRPAQTGDCLRAWSKRELLLISRLDASLLSVLILAATPIGNLSDASKRLEKTLTEASFIAAEDTRELKRLCRGLGITLNAKLFSLHEHNERDRIDELVELAQDETVVLVSDAGMPTISDPGFLLVRACADAGVEIQIVPGPSAVVSALAVSGLPTDRFSFEGFLPRKSGERVRVFESLITEKRTMVFFEAPHRILESLKDARKVFGVDRLASVSRELTKKFEETKRGSLQDLVEWAENIPKGEMVLVVSGAGEEQLDYEQLGHKALLLAETGMGLKQASTELADKFGASKTAIYQHALQAKA